MAGAIVRAAKAGRGLKQSRNGFVRFQTRPTAGLPCYPPAAIRKLIANLSEEERTEGFLSAEFSREQVANIAEDLGTMLATLNGEVLAFLCAFRNEFDHESPVITKMLDTYPLVTFDSKTLSSYNVILAFRLPAQSAS